MSVAVECMEVTRTFHEEGQPAVTAVDSLSLTVRRGEIFCLVGPDGAGKTTTIRMMCGVLPPTSGEIRILGLAMDTDRAEIKTRIGYLSQRFSLYGDLTVDENIDFFAGIHGIKDHGERKLELLQLMRLESFRTRLADKLSGGMKQKLALACTLIHRPDVIFLDEPTTGVDPVSRRDFWKILSSVLKAGIAIVMATPYLDEAERANRVALLNGGRLLVCDTPEAMKAGFMSDVVEIIPEDVRDAFNRLRKVTWLQSVQLFGDRLHIALPPQRDTLGRLNDLLSGQGIRVRSQRTLMPTLEDVFISRIS